MNTTTTHTITLTGKKAWLAVIGTATVVLGTMVVIAGLTK